MSTNTVQPVDTFLSLLWNRDRALYSRYNMASLGLDIEYTNEEKDLLTCLAIKARKITNHQGE